MIIYKTRITKALIRLSGCAGWSAPVLFTNPRRQVFSCHGPFKLGVKVEQNVALYHQHHVTHAHAKVLGLSLYSYKPSIDLCFYMNNMPLSTDTFALQKCSKSAQNCSKSVSMHGLLSAASQIFKPLGEVGA